MAKSFLHTDAEMCALLPTTRGIDEFLKSEDFTLKESTKGMGGRDGDIEINRAEYTRGQDRVFIIVHKAPAVMEKSNMRRLENVRQ
jgi:hypothetical protein